jgi:MoxR-like ATPase
MASEKHSIQARLAELPRRDRARLALALISSLDPGRDEDVGDTWLEEAAQRLAAYDRGETSTLDANTVLDDIERELR